MKVCIVGHSAAGLLEAEAAAVTEDHARGLMAFFDKDGDGQVAFDEFYEMVTNGKQPPAGLGTGGPRSDSLIS